MKLKFLLHGLHPNSPQYPAHMNPYAMYDETMTQHDKESYPDILDNNKNLVAFASRNITDISSWVKYKPRKL